MDTISNVVMETAVDAQLCMQSTKMQRVVRKVGAAAMVFMLLLSAVSAAPNGIANIEGGIKAGTQQIYSIMTAVIVPIAVVFFVWAAYKMLFGGEKGVEQAKKSIFTIVVVLALVWLAPLLVTEVSGWFSGTGDQGVFN